jgi:hypothetical protein
MKELRTEIIINTSPEKVWKIMTDLAQYPKWNPFICHAIGRAEPGQTVDIDFQPDGKGLKLHCTVARFQTNRELGWKYHVTHPFLFRGEHIFTIEPLGENRVRFIDREEFNGLLLFTQVKDIDTNTKRGFETMNKALKARAEAK